MSSQNCRTKTHVAPSSPTPILRSLLPVPPRIRSMTRYWNKHKGWSLANEIGNLANVASLLWHAYASLPKPSSAVNWAGFYVRDDLFPLLASPKRSNSISGLTTTTITTSYASHDDRKLLLGPFQGRPACQEIKFGRGVCGTAAAKKETVVVPDVLEFPGHIACDADSRSEIVVPIIFEGETVAIIDIDCTEPAGFDETDQRYLERLAQLLSENFDATKRYANWPISANKPRLKHPPPPIGWHGPLVTTLQRIDYNTGFTRSIRPLHQLACFKTALIAATSLLFFSFSSSLLPSPLSAVGSLFSLSTIQSTWSAVPPESPVPPWPTASSSSLSSVLSRPQQDDSHEQTNSIFDFSFEHNSFPSSSASSSSPTVPLADFSSSSLWEASCQVESLDQLAGILELDFLLADPTSGLGSTHSQYPGPSVATQQQSFDLSLAFGDHGHPSSSYSPGNMTEGGNALNMDMNAFYSTNTSTVSATSTAAPTTTNIAVSPLSMTSLPSQEYHHQQHQPFLAPKPRTPPSSSSSSFSSPASSNATTIAVKSNKNTQSTSRKRSRATATAESASVDLSSNNSAQDSEEERIVEKRRRNTMAARRFRKRKQDHVEDLESQLSTMTKERDDLKLQVAKWEGEVMALRKLLDMKK
ncbi:hypothetical protein UA08_01750 [Talaromyces atroroseus]|uniref:BZIP domain-containing protein n=1 Tax=Talaromyces atroroseus TaxID=1441469 RepID=A0A1Q5QBT0_TALAT|nr:hypothetical protein UA08_01750 [Talaromyces atroroseus]OKL63366.1 hypothetical protein UA08_01750 [Talaromyces atroroseus]